MSEQEQEKKNQRQAFLYTLGIQVVIFLLLFVMVAYRPPNPPNPQIGVELNLGFDDQGGGENPATTPVGDEGTQPEETQNQPEEEQPEEVQEVVPEEVIPTDTKPAEDIVSTKTESPVAVKDKKEEKPVEKPKEKEPEKKAEPEKPRNTYTPPAENKTGTKEGKAGSEGTDEGKTGNKGKEGGQVASNVYQGTPGSGKNGVSMSGFDGFDWPEIKAPAIPNDANGVYEFEVEVNEQGEVIGVNAKQRGLSGEAERKFKEYIRSLEFTAKGSPKKSKGTITFRVTSQ